MKRGVFAAVLTGEAVVCIAASNRVIPTFGSVPRLLSFPFELIGKGLRNLSLSSEGGNVIAIICYFMICLLPIATLLVVSRRRKLYKEDAILVLLSVSLFLVIYLMINPGVIQRNILGATNFQIGNAIICMVVYSIITGYFVLRTLRRSLSDDRKVLALLLAMMLKIIATVIVFIVFFILWDSFTTSLSSIKNAYDIFWNPININSVFACIMYIVSALPYLLNIIIIMKMLSMLDEYVIDPYSQETVVATNLVARLCAVTLSVVMICSICFNILQVIFMPKLYNVSISANIPVFSIAFVMAALLFARFISDSKSIKDENDSFI